MNVEQLIGGLSMADFVNRARGWELVDMCVCVCVCDRWEDFGMA